ncbi:MAG: hypothetical protein HYY24_03560 [Verrucomicrobia bacterium]|nr:hypothetical protein [Verrucomicrobiota bacterium]
MKPCVCISPRAVALALVALLLVFWARAAEPSGPQITKFTYQKDGTAALEWSGADKRVTVQVSGLLTPAEWQSVPGVNWPLDSTKWTGILPRGQSAFVRILTHPATGQAVPSKSISLNLIGIHDPSSSRYNQDCISCHGDRTKEVALDGKTPMAHSTMLLDFGTGNNRCLNCHQGGPDFLTASSGGLREPVDISSANCVMCHGADGGAKEFYVQ